jgi:hypothetical protein
MQAPTVPRAKLIEQIRKHLEQQGWPRFQMLLIVSLTALSGWLFSAVLLRLGMTSMGTRYPSATLLAYGVFLGMLWMWLKNRSDGEHTASRQVAETADVLVDAAYRMSDSSARSLAPTSHSLVPSSGSSGYMDLPTSNLSVNAGSGSRSWFSDFSFGSRSGSSSGGGSGGDSNELAVILLIVVLALAVFIACGYLVLEAPALLAEISLDGAVAGTLYTRLKEAERQHWMRSAFGYTWWVLLLLLLVTALVGFGLQEAVPGAVTMGEALAG